MEDMITISKTDTIKRIESFAPNGVILNVSLAENLLDRYTDGEYESELDIYIHTDPLTMDDTHALKGIINILTTHLLDVGKKFGLIFDHEETDHIKLEEIVNIVLGLHALNEISIIDTPTVIPVLEHEELTDLEKLNIILVNLNPLLHIDIIPLYVRDISSNFIPTVKAKIDELERNTEEVADIIPETIGDTAYKIIDSIAERYTGTIPDLILTLLLDENLFPHISSTVDQLINTNTNKANLELVEYTDEKEKLDKLLYIYALEFTSLYYIDEIEDPSNVKALVQAKLVDINEDLKLNLDLPTIIKEVNNAYNLLNESGYFNYLNQLGEKYGEKTEHDRN